MEAKLTAPNNSSYQSKSSPINADLIPEFVLTVIKKLQQYDFQAFIVGGCIRDMLLNRVPKDFDVATDAHPEQITTIFKNSRIIGRRFKIVHIRQQRELIEVSTFRKKPEEVNKLRNGVIQDNAFGTIVEDAERRDFTMNAIFYDPIHETFFDPFNGKKDIENSQINFIGKKDKRLREDPIRLLRAIRFNAKLGFALCLTKKEIPTYIQLLDDIPYSRIFDEMMKFFLTGHAEKSIKVLKQYEILDIFFPHLAQHSLKEKSLLMLGMKNTDNRVKQNKTVNPGFLMAVVLWDAFKKDKSFNDETLSLDAKIKNFFNQSAPNIFIHKRFIKYISDIWRLQPRFLKIGIKAVYRLSNHPRFRAAYDFLLLRSESGEEDKKYGDWWTRWQSANELTRKQLLDQKDE